jgi:hypothetical protein
MGWQRARGLRGGRRGLGFGTFLTKGNNTARRRLGIWGIVMVKIGKLMLLAVSVAAGGWPAGAVAGSYVFTTLSGTAKGVNALNQVAGGGAPSGVGGYVWADGTYTSIGEADSELIAITKKGIAIGNVDTGKKAYGITYTLSDGAVHKVKVDGQKETSTIAINDSGAIIGLYQVKGAQYGTAFLLVKHSATILAPPNSIYTLPAAINDSGTVVGSFGESGAQPMFIYANGTYTTASAPGVTAETVPIVITSSGEIGGFYYSETTNSNHGFLYSGGTFTTIDYPGAIETGIYGIGPSGEIIGEWEDSNVMTHGFVDVRGTFYSINVAGSTSTTVSAVSSDGSIVGFSQENYGNPTAFVAICPAGQSPCTQ